MDVVVFDGEPKSVLLRLAEQAASLVSFEVELSRASFLGLPYEAHYYPDAVLRGVFHTPDADPPDRWRSIPTLTVHLYEPELGKTYRPEDYNYLDGIGISDDDIAARIAEWLYSHSPGELNANEHALLEVLLTELTSLLQNTDFRLHDPNDVAQAQAAADTMQAQLKAPRPSKKVLKWAVSQIPGFMFGLLSNVANDAIIHFGHIH